MQIFPADNVLIEDSSNALYASGRLHAFESEQGPLLRVSNWSATLEDQSAFAPRFYWDRAEEPTSLSDTQDPFAEASEEKAKESRSSSGGDGRKGAGYPITGCRHKTWKRLRSSAPGSKLNVSI